MSHKVIAVVYTTKSQNSAPGRFTVPASVCKILGIDKGAKVQVEVESASGRYGPATLELRSDREPQPARDMKDWMRAGEEITVTVRRG